MRLLIFFCLSSLLVLPGQAQERVRNVRMRVLDSSQLEMRYDLINARPGDSIYVEVRSRLRGALRILPEFVQGDVGKRIVAGSNRRIIWDALANGYSLSEEIRATVLVKTGLPLAPQPPLPAKPVAVTRPDPDRPAPDIVEKSKRDESVTVTPRPVETRPTPTDVPTPAAQPPTRPVEPVPPPTRTDGPVHQPNRTDRPVDQPGVARPGVAQSTPIDALPQPGMTQPDVAQPDAPQPEAVVRPDTVAIQKRRYAGPVWALLSAVAPGIGNIFVQTPKPRIGLRPLLTAGCYGLLVYGVQERQKSREVYAIYEQQKNAETAEPYYQTANDYYHRYYLATRGAIVVAAADVILTFFKGLRNVRATAPNRPLQSVTLRPGLQAGQPTAVVRYSF